MNLQSIYIYIYDKLWRKTIIPIPGITRSQADHQPHFISGIFSCLKSKEPVHKNHKHEAYCICLLSPKTALHLQESKVHIRIPMIYTEKKNTTFHQLSYKSSNCL